MEIRTSRVLLRFLTALFFVSFSAIVTAAQGDPDPNSPTPILLSEYNSTRALAKTSGGFGKVDIRKLTNQAFAPDSTVDLYVTNIKLMSGEGASAFRLYAIDKAGHQFRFPVLDLQSYPDVKGTFIITVKLTDEIGYWAPPDADGDVLVCLTWRGLASNEVKLGIGQTGGDIKENPNSRPTPLGTAADKASIKGSNDMSSPEYVGYRWSGDRIRLLEQATFGPTPALDDRIRRIGPKAWLAEQFAEQYPSAANPYPNQPLKPTNAVADCDGAGVDDVPATCNRDSYTMYQPQIWFMKEAYYSNAQLRHRVSWALSQILVTSGVDIQQGRHMVEYHKILSNNAFGNFRTMMKQITLSPTMGDYLSMAGSTKTNPNENYAREVMQLFSVGLFMLNQDGTVQCVEHNPCQTGDTPVPTYDQNAVNNMTRVLTGWNFCSVQASCPNLVAGSPNYVDPMLLFTNNHDTGAKTLLAYPGSTTTNVAACTGCNTAQIATYANASMDQALDNIFNHPNVGPFISKNLIQQMVTSDPTPAYVGRIAAVFNNNGLGVRGDLKAVVRAILLDPEARGDSKTDPNFGKLREPVQLTTNLLRQFNVRSADTLSQSDGSFGILQNNNGRVNEFVGMAQMPFLSPTVFNFFPPGYVIPGTSLVGPEFALMTTGTSIQRANFVNRMVFSNIAVSQPDYPNGTSLDFSDLQALSQADSSGNQLLDDLNRRMMHGTMSASMRSTILTAVTNIPATTNENFLQRARQAVYLIATSSQFQVQR